jgi:hypothetical protein
MGDVAGGWWLVEEPGVVSRRRQSVAVRKGEFE